MLSNLASVPQSTGTKHERKLCRLYKKLPKEDRKTLMDFAEFLVSKANPTVETVFTSQPNLISRPKNESVVKAIKRLSASYPMLEKNKLFHTTSSLMTAHIMHGKTAEKVIDELEIFFAQEYQLLSENRDDKTS